MEEPTELRSTLKSLFPDPWLRAAASEAGFVRRQRKVSPVAFFWTLVLGFGAGSTRSISNLRRAYARACSGCWGLPLRLLACAHQAACRIVSPSARVRIP